MLWERAHPNSMQGSSMIAPLVVDQTLGLFYHQVTTCIRLEMEQLYKMVRWSMLDTSTD